MRGHMIPAATIGAILVGCTAPPRPATVDESKRRPANSNEAISFQICQHELDSSRRHAAETERNAAQLNAALLNQSVQRAMTESDPGQRLTVERANTIYTLHFDFASSRLELSPPIAVKLLYQARNAPWVVIRGRTDGSSDAPSENKIARERAKAVEAYLLAAGLDASRIRTTYQPSGDHVADNSTAQGRRLNRRVEIELYALKPQSVQLDRDSPEPSSEGATDGGRNSP